MLVSLMSDCEIKFQKIWRIIYKVITDWRSKNHYSTLPDFVISIILCIFKLSTVQI